MIPALGSRPRKIPARYRDEDVDEDMGEAASARSSSSSEAQDDEADDDADVALGIEDEPIPKGAMDLKFRLSLF